MKTWVKVILIAAAVMACLGALLMGIGLMLGGGAGRTPASASPETAAGAGEDSRYEVTGDIREITVEWVAGDVILEPWDGDTLVLEETGDEAYLRENPLRYVTEDGELTVQYMHSRHFFSLPRRGEKKLKVLIPESMLGQLQEVSINAVSSDCYVRDLTLQSLETETVSGTVRCENVTVEEVEAETVSGHFIGNFPVCPRSIEMNSVSGNMNLGLPENSRISLEWDSVSGSCSSDLPTENSGGSPVEAETVSGDLSIRKLGAVDAVTDATTEATGK